MTSILKVDTIQDADGNNIINENSNAVTIGKAADTVSIPGSATLGASGKTITIPSGCTITNSGTASGFGGITGADHWRLTTNFSGNANPIASNLERVDTDGYGTIGSAMTESSGIFTFPSTGIWLIHATFFTRCNGANRAHNGQISTTTNNSSYSDAAGNYSSMYNSGNDTYSNSSCEFIFDVTDTSTHKCKFDINTDNSSSVTGGNTDSSQTAFTFIRLGDT